MRVTGVRATVLTSLSSTLTLTLTLSLTLTLTLIGADLTELDSPHVDLVCHREVTCVRIQLGLRLGLWLGLGLDEGYV